jgi:predicted phage terminase large subunit-like protein
VDPASAKKKTSDYTAAWVVGLAADSNVYVLDMVRDRLSLTQRADLMFAWHKRWKPLRTGYERYGMMADIEHIEDRQDRENYRFPITELGGPMPKPDRIRRLIPWFEQGRVYLPRTLTKANYEGRESDLVADFVKHEYRAFPVASHDDMLDALARIFDDEMAIAWPQATNDDFEEWHDDAGRSSVTGY